MASDHTLLPAAQPRRLQRLVGRNGGFWCLVVALLPIAMTRFGLIPVYESQKSLLPALAAFFCLLTLAYVFSQRHRMARAMFAARLLWTEVDPFPPRATSRMSINGGLAYMILGALSCAAVYLWGFEAGRASPTFPKLPPNSANAVLLAISYVTMFLLAEGAFTVVAVREHLQNVLGLTDAEVITGVPRPSERVAIAPPVTTRHPGVAVFSERSERLVPHGPTERDQFPSEFEHGKV
jgi:hypothetical protein